MGLNRGKVHLGVVGRGVSFGKNVDLCRPTVPYGAFGPRGGVFGPPRPPPSRRLRACNDYNIWKRLFAPQRGGQEEADRLFAPQWSGQEEANRLFAPQRGGQEKQLCYSPRSAANKRFHFIIRPAADYVTRHLIGQFW